MLAGEPGEANWITAGQGPHRAGGPFLRAKLADPPHAYLLCRGVYQYRDQELGDGPATGVTPEMVSIGKKPEKSRAE